ncbi:VWA domain-containing protein [Candidatus Nitronereus thalassa]|uniref:VWA domain-containing protein n=1 Tax=Candidatus Nitronereus thalassa TaxID=3020898 RepID=A0ABU3K9H3_9BACT|nr:VWA domain-containing protein [Candidatus Nitronereus thalassa]MDT7042943.1 VWA domain-containing protein [Candidatus Nitronereus thalassa]
MMEFAWPWVLVGLLLPFVVRYVLPRATPLKSESALRVPFYQAVTEGEGGHVLQKSSPLQSGIFWMAFLVWTCLVIAGARPQWVGDPIALPVSGRDVMLAVDLSGSMEIPDFALNGEKANRLQVVKEVAGEFIQRRKGDRLGLILFGSKAYLQTPLTFDRQTVQQMLRESAIGLAGKETAIGDALGLAVKRFQHQSQDHRILILLTDGSNTAGEVDPIQAAKLAAKEGIRIHAIGVGSDYMEMDTMFGTRVVNPASDLDEKTLSTIAELTGGVYFRARDTKGLETVYQQLDQIEPVITDTEYFRPITDLYVWPLGVAMMLSMLMSVRHLGLRNPFSKREKVESLSGASLSKVAIG